MKFHFLLIFVSLVTLDSLFAQKVTPGVTTQSDYNNLKSFIGKWKMVETSFKNQVPDSIYKPISNIFDIHETMYGIEIITMHSFYRAGKPDSNMLTETFVPDFTRITYYILLSTNHLREVYQVLSEKLFLIITESL